MLRDFRPFSHVEAFLNDSFGLGVRRGVARLVQCEGGKPKSFFRVGRSRRALRFNQGHGVRAVNQGDSIACYTSDGGGPLLYRMY